MIHVKVAGTQNIGNKHMKTCFKCNEQKPLSEFYRHPRMAGGRLGKCKQCTKKDVSTNYRNNIDHYKEYERSRAMLTHRVKAREEYQKSPAGRASISKSKKKWKEANLIKRAAHVIVGNAIRDGKLIKRPCEICGSEYRVHAHHEDYAKPLDVKWLCPRHHIEHHKRQK